MEWPSQRVRPGGLFQPAKIKYSPETKDFLKVLMEESKLTMLQRQKVNYALRSGYSLPTLNETERNVKSKQIDLNDRPSSPRRRSLNTILKSGAYERDRYIPKYPMVDRNKSIERLQNMMYYGKEEVKNKKNDATLKKKREKKTIQPQEMTYEELRQEVEERQNFLNEMEKLGEGKKYRSTINQQITVLLNEMEKLNVKGTK